MKNPTKKVWPPGFIPQYVPEPTAAQKKAEAATRARKARIEADVNNWGVNTVPKKDTPHGPVSEHLMRHWYGAKR